MAKKVYRIEWKGHFSLNKLYEGGHWTRRNSLKQKWKLIFTEAIQASGATKLPMYTLTIRYNSRLDPSNVTGMLKVLEDTLRELGLIVDDTKKFCRGVGIVPDESLGVGCYVAEFGEV